MKINVSKEILDLEGKPFGANQEVMLYDNEKKQPVLDDKGNPIIVSIETGENVTFKDVLLKLLMSATDKDTADKKIAMFKLLQKVSNGGEIEISIDEAKLLNDLSKERLASILIIGRIDELLNNN